MRVAVLAEWYPSPADPVHGLWAHRQAVASAAAGAEVQVLALRRPVPPLSVIRRGDPRALAAWAAGMRRTLAPWSRDGLVVHSVPWLGPPRPVSYGTWGWWMSPSLRVVLDRLWSAWRFDVLHAHCLAPAGHAAARWVSGRRGAERPAFTVSAHGGDMIRVPEASAFGRRAVEVALSSADLVVANSSWARTRCETLAGGPLQCEVVHLGASVAAGVSAAAVAGADERLRLRLITIAHLQDRKRHRVVLEAIARLEPAIRPDYLIVGDGEMRAPLQALVAELGLGERVRFTGQLPNEQALARLADADLFVMPGVEEPFGVAFVEAMAAGVPAIGSRGEGGPQDIAAAGPGMVLVAADDVAELTAVLADFAHDREKLRRLGAAARATARAHFTWERCGEATLAAYERALALSLADR